MYVTTDGIHDSEALPSIRADASRHRLISEAYMDGAYDSIKSYRLLKRAGIKPIIKPRRNARMDRGPPEKRSSAITFKELGEWGRLMGYGGLLRRCSQHSNAYTENTSLRVRRSGQRGAAPYRLLGFTWGSPEFSG